MVSIICTYCKGYIDIVVNDNKEKLKKKKLLLYNFTRSSLYRSPFYICIFNFIWQEYEVRWHCIQGRGYCFWHEFYGWSELNVNTTAVTINMTRYNMAYVFEVRVLTPQGRGKPSQLYYAVPEFSGMPTQFICKLEQSNYLIVCHWVPPTDFNPSGFYVSSKT